MKFSPVQYLLPLLPALVLSTRQDYEDLEKQLKEVFKERSTILHQLTKTSRELDGIKTNLQSLKNEEKSAKIDVQKLLEISEQQREQMKSLQVALQSQLKETAEKVEKQQATINFLKTELERKTKMIRDLQNENKSLKNKLLSGSKLCGLHAEESRKIQAQLKELRYGKKDLLLKAQQLTELEQKLAVARNELEKAALDKDSQMKAMKETVKLCLSTVFQNQPPPLSLTKTSPTQMPTVTIDTLILSSRKNDKDQQSSSDVNMNVHFETNSEGRLTTIACDSQHDKNCTKKQVNTSNKDNGEAITTEQKLQVSPCDDCEVTNKQEKQLANFEGRPAREEKIL